MKKFIVFIMLLLLSMNCMAALKVGKKYAVKATPDMIINVAACESSGLPHVWGDDHLSYGVLQWQKVTFNSLKRRAHMTWLHWKNPLHQVILFKWAVENGWAHYWTCYRKLYVRHERRKIQRKIIERRMHRYLVKVFPPTHQQGEYAMSQATQNITIMRGELLDAQPAIEALGKTYTPVGKDSYWLAKIMTKLTKKLKQEQRNAQRKINDRIKKYGKELPNGRFGVDPNDVETMQKYQDEVDTDVMGEKITIDVPQLKLSKLEEYKVSLTVADQSVLFWLLEEA